MNMNIAYIKKSLLFLFGAVILLTACKEDEIDLFSGENNVYFSLKRWNSNGLGLTYDLEYPINGKIYTQKWDYRKEAMDSINKSYALDVSGALFDTAYIPVSLMGFVTDYDRDIAYKLGPATEAVEGKDFKILEAKIPANKPLGAIVVEIDRTSIKDASYRIDLTLIPNSEFQTNYKTINRNPTDTTKLDLRDFRLRISDLLESPAMWGTLSGWFDKFSRKKLYLVAELTGGDLKEFYAERPNLSTIISWSQILKRHLQQQKAAGTPVYEEDGVTEMKVGPYA